MPTRVQLLFGGIGLLIAALGVVFAGMQALKNDPQPTAIVIKPEASIKQVVTGGGEVSASGEFRYVDLGAELILLVGHPDGVEAAPWVPIVADAEPGAATAGSRVDGVWEALGPYQEEGRFAWQVIVIEGTGGPAGSYPDVSALGPATEGVVWASEVFKTGD
jgi:hypothetical protein